MWFQVGKYDNIESEKIEICQAVEILLPVV